MPSVVRIGDSLSTGHPCTPVTSLVGANQGTVYSNSILASVPGAPTAVHTKLVGDVCKPHGAVLNAGSPTVFVEGAPLGRVGDSADAGAMISGSPNVFANGG